MQAALTLTTTVLPGHRIEVDAPELTEGEEIELIVLRQEPSASGEYIPALDYLNSLGPSQLTMADWERIEREIQEEKNSWER
jgi:hypothetical protein